MALNGIPISDEQCIGDSLPIINNAFSTLDSSITAVNAAIDTIQNEITNTASVADLDGYVAKPTVDDNDRFKVLTYDFLTTTWVASSVPNYTTFIGKPATTDSDAFKVLTFVSSTSSWVASANPMNTATFGADGSLNDTSGVVVQWGY